MGKFCQQIQTLLDKIIQPQNSLLGSRETFHAELPLPETCPELCSVYIVVNLIDCFVLKNFICMSDEVLFSTLFNVILPRGTYIKSFAYICFLMLHQ